MWVGFATQGGCFTGNRTSRQWKDCWNTGGTGSSEAVAAVTGTGGGAGSHSSWDRRQTNGGKVKGIGSLSRSHRKTRDLKLKPAPPAETSRVPVVGRFWSVGHRGAALHGGSQAGHWPVTRVRPHSVRPGSGFGWGAPSRPPGRTRRLAEQDGTWQAESLPTSASHCSFQTLWPAREGGKWAFPASFSLSPGR